MLKLAVIPHPRMAQAFVDYMAARQVDVTLQRDENGHAVLWLNDENHLADVQAELRAFLSDPDNSKYQAASWKVADSRTASFSYQSESLLSVIKAKSGPFTLLIMAASVAVYLAMLLGAGNTIVNLLFFPSDAEQSWQLWRLFSHALLHFSAIHLIFNLLWWWVLGGKIEQHSGSAKLLQLFLFTALVSGVGQYTYGGGPYFGGLSGVVYALLGYLWWLGWLAPERGLSIETSYVGFMLLWLVIGFFEPFGMAIANMAHLFGLITGCLMGFADAKFKRG